MYTIKEAARRTGIPVASLRAWERRYQVVEPRRTDSGYRLYDDRAIAVLTAMRRLVDDGWSPAAAAATVTQDGPEAVLARVAPPPGATRGDDGGQRPHAGTRPAEEPPEPSSPAVAPVGHPEGPALTEALVEAASAVDTAAVESLLEQGFALGTFEAVVDDWLMPTMRALGEAWAGGHVDVVGEHAASYAVMRRLGQAFAAASSLTDGPRVLVGLPSGSHHEIGALAFATAARRRGLAVVYVGADLPLASWRRAVRIFPTGVAVIAVPTADDRPMAVRTAQALLEESPDVIVAAGGRHADDLAEGVVRLPHLIAEAAQAVGALRG